MLLRKGCQHWGYVTKEGASTGDIFLRKVPALGMYYLGRYQHWGYVTKEGASTGDMLLRKVPALGICYLGRCQHWGYVT